MKKVFVIGDPIQDIFHYGSILGISAESPTMVMKKEKTEIVPGGASLVTAHLEKLGVNVVQYPTNPVVIKERFFVDGHKLFQTDEFKKCNQFVPDNGFDFLKNFDAVVIADNNHGVMGIHNVPSLMDVCTKYNVPVFVDSQYSQTKPHHRWYTGCTVMFLNEKEASSYFLIDIDNNLNNAIAQLSIAFKCDIVLKLGKNGVAALLEGDYHRIEGIKVDVKDTCGAGDAFMAALVSRDDPFSKESLKFANNYAAQTCTYEGTRVR